MSNNPPFFGSTNRNQPTAVSENFEQEFSQLVQRNSMDEETFSFTTQWESTPYSSYSQENDIYFSATEPISQQASFNMPNVLNAYAQSPRHTRLEAFASSPMNRNGYDSSYSTAPMVMLGNRMRSPMNMKSPSCNNSLDLGDLGRSRFSGEYRHVGITTPKPYNPTEAYPDFIPTDVASVTHSVSDLSSCGDTEISSLSPPPLKQSHRLVPYIPQLNLPVQRRSGEEQQQSPSTYNTPSPGEVSSSSCSVTSVHRHRPSPPASSANSSRTVTPAPSPSPSPSPSPYIVSSSMTPSVSAQSVQSDNSTGSKPTSGRKRFNCTQCTKSFSERSGLVRHFRIHSGEAPFKCDVCNRRFKQRSTLVSHVRIHTGEKPYSCHVCNKPFRHNGSLHRHLRVHRNRS